MIRLRPLVLPLALLLLLPLLPGRAAAAPVAFDRALHLDWPLPDARVLRFSILRDPRPLVQVRLFTVQITLLPSGALVARAVVALPQGRSDAPRPAPEPVVVPVVVPLPAALPLFLLALAGLVVVGRRRRPPALAQGKAPS